MNLHSCLIILSGLVFFSHSYAQNSSVSEVDIDESAYSELDIDNAMDALNEIQVSGDGKMMLYLTFPNIYHDECIGVVSTIKISREEFHDALIEVMSKNNQRITGTGRDSLASVASKPLGYYTLKTCGSTTKYMKSMKGAVPTRQGTWIIPEIFGVSDLLINW